MRSFIPAAIFLFLITGASAQTAAPDAADQKPSPSTEHTTVTADAPVAPKPIKIICVKSAAETGSHMGATKECHSEAEWDMIHHQSERTMDRFHTILNSQSPDPKAGR
ncbi:MAG: hypothetical protein JWP16_2010 [Alphaproteobacteria bacterium]|jgi:hypothetical protein|nr:hypothetical protein [Alphaproteobacteria bacterium]